MTHKRQDASGQAIWASTRSMNMSDAVHKEYSRLIVIEPGNNMAPKDNSYSDLSVTIPVVIFVTWCRACDIVLHGHTPSVDVKLHNLYDSCIACEMIGGHPLLSIVVSTHHSEALFLAITDCCQRNHHPLVGRRTIYACSCPVIIKIEIEGEAFRGMRYRCLAVTAVHIAE